MSTRKVGYVMVILLVGGCSFAKVTPLTIEDVLENSYVSFTAPSGGWYLLGKRVWGVNGNGEIANLDRDRDGSHYHIRAHTYPHSDIPNDFVFKKDSNFDAAARDYVSLDATDKEQRISYKRGWTTYVQGMKCTGTVFSRNFGGSVYQAMSKNYTVWCGYYHKTEGKRLLFFFYNYNYALGDSRLQEDEGKDRSELLTQPQAEEGLKQAMKELVGSLEIKNLDRERMEREGLWHPGKPFEVSEF